MVAGAALVAHPDAPATAIRLGASMVLLQFAIGALNDVVDAPRDAGRRPGKPIPAGIVTSRGALLVATTTALGGVALAVPSGPTLVALALVGLGIGAWYDLALKGTAWSWLPFALGIPLLPVYGWLGAAGSLPAVFLVLVPVAFAEGAALAIANGLADMELDRAAGVTSVAQELGATSSGVVLGLQGAVIAIAVATAVLFGMPIGWIALTVLAGALVLGGAAAARPTATPGRRGQAWAAQAIGATALAVAWLGGAVTAGAI